jgi:hypothetical protein
VYSKYLHHGLDIAHSTMAVYNEIVR